MNREHRFSLSKMYNSYPFPGNNNVAGIQKRKKERHLSPEAKSPYSINNTHRNKVYQWPLPPNRAFILYTKTQNYYLTCHCFTCSLVVEGYHLAPWVPQWNRIVIWWIYPLSFWVHTTKLDLFKKVKKLATSNAWHKNIQIQNFLNLKQKFEALHCSVWFLPFSRGITV